MNMDIVPPNTFRARKSAEASRVRALLAAHYYSDGAILAVQRRIAIGYRKAHAELLGRERYQLASFLRQLEDLTATTRREARAKRRRERRQ